MRRALVTGLVLLAAGCAREVEPAAPVPAGYAGHGQSIPYGYAWPPRVLVNQPASTKASSSPAPAPPRPAWGAQPTSAGSPPPTGGRLVTFSSSSIPGGDACLQRLAELGLSYRELDAKKGVRTPVVISGRVGGIHYYANGNLPLLCDCRLAVALRWIAPLLQAQRVSDIRFSGAYSYRKARTGKLSLHAYGLAIDIHELTVGGRRLSVKRDFRRGLSRGCAARAPALNRIACQLQKTGLFNELLTPDSDRDHHDHFHLAIAPLPASSASPARVATAAQ